MFNLFLHTLSQGLQAFVPVAAALSWFGRREPTVTSAILRGAVLSAPATVAAAWMFKTSTARALEEAALAAIALVIAVLFLSFVWRTNVVTSGAGGRRRLFLILAAVAASTCLIVVRQTMEIGSVFAAAAFDLRSRDATATVICAAALPALVAWLWIRIGRRVPAATLHCATRTFAIVFVVQLLVYAFHESAEAHLLPWSTALHAATEPYGPDGIYGLHFSELLVLLPIAAAMVTSRRAAPVTAHRLASYLVLAIGAASAAGVAASRPRVADATPPFERPHVLFRETGAGPAFGTLSLAPIDAPDRGRQSTGLPCERISFGGSTGLCLHAERSLFGLFLTYTAVLTDGDLRPRGTPLELDGRPSRTRVAPNGRVGAITVFVIGDDYAANFSTRTTLVDLRTGSPIGDLEQFTTWRNGERFSSKDFNFWGVTFAPDGDTFYASLRTSGSTYLVRGLVSSRTVIVLRENVECPSLSPDNRLIAFKKHVGPDPGAWRLAVLDVATMHEHLIAGESRYIDDQVEWLDAGHVLYSVPRRTTSIVDVWVAAIDGDSPARVFLPQAESPVVVRGLPPIGSK